MIKGEYPKMTPKNIVFNGKWMKREWEINISYHPSNSNPIKLSFHLHLRLIFFTSHLFNNSFLEPIWPSPCIQFNAKTGPFRKVSWKQILKLSINLSFLFLVIQHQHIMGRWHKERMLCSAKLRDQKNG